MFKLIILLFLFGTSVNIFSQETKFDTHSLILKGELTSEDVFEKDFGRFDAYELPMEEGDLIKMKLTASFFPLMIIAAPSSEYKMAFPQDNNPVVIYQQEIDETGLWYIYIAGDSLDRGEHSLELCYVSKDARVIPDDADFITILELFLAHSVTNYLYFTDTDTDTDTDCEFESGEWDVKLDSYGKYKSAKIVSQNGVSVLTVNFEPGDELFKEMQSELKANFAKNWNIRISDSENLVELIEIEGLRKISLRNGENEITLKISAK